VLNRVKDYRRVTWAQLFEKSDVIGVDDKQLQIGLQDVGAHRAFSQGGHDEIVRQALIDVVGLDLAVVAVLDPSASGAAAPPPAAPAAPAAQSGSTSTTAAAAARAAAAAVDRPVVGKERGSDAADDEVDLDDPDADDDGLAGPDLIAQQLGGTVIGEIDHV
jgi:DNA polymerase-3 subunit gamma/tau